MNVADLLGALNSAGFHAMRTLFALTWQSGIVLCAAGVVALLLRKQSAAARRAVWIAALFAVPILPWLVELESRINVPQAPLPVMTMYVAPEMSAPAPADEPRTVAAPAAVTEAPAEPGVSVLAYPWAICLTAYLVFAGVMLCLVLAARVGLDRRARRGTPVEDARVLRAFGAAREKLRLRRAVRVVESVRIEMPLAIGTLGPVVLLPTGFAESLSDDDLAAVALHETAHVKRLDSLTLDLASVLRALFFFHPLVWYACRRIALLTEEAADDAVLDATHAPVAYAKTLALLAERIRHRSFSAHLAASIVFSKSAFVLRVGAILSDKRPAIRALSVAGIIAAAVGIVASLVLAAAVPISTVTNSTDSATTPASDTAKQPIASAQELQNAKLVDSIIAAHDSSQWWAPQGAGEAIVRTSEVTTRQDPRCPVADSSTQGTTDMVFKFRGPMQRTEAYVYDDKGTRGELRFTHIEQADKWLDYWPSAGSVGIGLPARSPSRYNLGQDFAPASIARLGRREFAGEMKRILRIADYFTTSVDDNGLLKIVSGRSRGEHQTRTEVVLDTRRDYAVVSYDFSLSDDQADTSYSYRVDWDPNTGVHYFTTAVSREEVKYKGAARIVGPDVLQTTEVVIRAFDPTAAISDADFTLESLHLPEGIMISDGIADNAYEYRGTKADPSAMKSTDSATDVVTADVAELGKHLVDRLGTLAHGTIEYETRVYVTNRAVYDQLRNTIVQAQYRLSPDDIDKLAGSIGQSAGARATTGNSGNWYYDATKADRWRITRVRLPEFTAPGGTSSGGPDSPRTEDVAFDGEYVTSVQNGENVIYRAKAAVNDYPRLIELDISLGPWHSMLEEGPRPGQRIIASADDDEHTLVFASKEGGAKASSATYVFSASLGYAPLRLIGQAGGDVKMETLYAYSEDRKGTSLPTPRLTMKADFTGGGRVQLTVWRIKTWKDTVREEDLSPVLPESYVMVDERTGKGPVFISHEAGTAPRAPGNAAADTAKPGMSTDAAARAVGEDKGVTVRSYDGFKEIVTATQEKAILEAFKAHCEKITSIEFTQTADTTDPRTGKPSLVPYEQTVKWEFNKEKQFQRQRFSCDSIATEPQYVVRNGVSSLVTYEDVRRIVVFDGSVWRYLITGKEGKGGSGVCSHSIKYSTDIPALEAMCTHDRYSPDLLVGSGVVSGTAERDGHQVYVIKVNYGDADTQTELRYEVDPEHDFALRYASSRSNGRIFVRADVKELILQDGVWLPSVFDRQMGENGPTWTYKVSYKRVNPRFSDDDFKLAWPAGAHVVDEINGTEYTVPENAAPGTGKPGMSTDSATPAVGEVDKAVKDAAAGLKPIEWHSPPAWDGKSPNTPADAEKAKRIVSRFKENFLKINTIALHHVETFTFLRPLTGDDEQNAKMHQKDIRVELQRDPLLFKVKGSYGGEAIDATVTPAGKIHNGGGIGFVESMVPSYLNGEMTGSLDEILGSTMTITENVPADAEMVKALGKEAPLAENGRYDVLTHTGPDGGSLSYWFRKDTGMIEYKLIRNAPGSSAANPFVGIHVLTYQNAGGIYYEKVIDTWTANRNNVGPASYRFETRLNREFSDVVINGIKAEE